MRRVELPTVSIIIAAARAAGSVSATLDSIEEQDYHGEIEVIVAAADSETRDVAASRAIVLDNPSGTTPAALNLALEKSNGEVIVRVDAHSRIPPDYVSRAVSGLLGTGAENLGGMQIPRGETMVEKAIAAAMASPMGAGDATYRIGGTAGPADTVYLGTFHRKTLVDLGGYDERFVRHQDYELNQRIRSRGGVVWFDPELRVEYRPRASFGELARQYFQYGRFKRYFSREYPGSLKPRQIAPPVLVVALASSLLGAIWAPWLLIVPGAYVTALLLFGLASLPRQGSPAFLMPLALATMHVSWGTGFLVGQSSDS